MLNFKHITSRIMKRLSILLVPSDLICLKSKHYCTHPQLACEILINLRFSDFIAPQAKQRNNASLWSSGTQAPTFPAYNTTD